jgi:signal peptidase I
MPAPTQDSLYRQLLSMLLAFALVPVLGLTVAQPWHIQGSSMEPSLTDGSVLIVDGVTPHVDGYHRGDIVIVPLPPDSEYPHPILVKRIVALGGEQIRIADGRVYVNGERLHEPYLPPGTTTSLADGQPLELVVPPGSVFVLGDYRGNSYDSKAFGPVPADSLRGRAWFALDPSGVATPDALAGGG